MLDHLFFFKSDEPQGGGWKKPEQSNGGSGWRKPAETPPQREGWRAPEGSSSKASAGWRRLPTETAAEAEEARKSVETEAASVAKSGGWHTPAPDETTYDADADVNGDAVTEAAAEDSAEAPAEVLPFDGEGAQPQATDSASETSAAGDEDVIDDDTFSMSELIALASLVDNPPVGALEQAAPAEEAAAEPADPDDPAAYARRQLEQLQAREAEPAVDDGATQPQQSTPVPEATSVTDPAEIARQQVEILAPSESPLTPQEEQLAQRYRAAEENIHALRAQYHEGKMTREQLQSELRRQMVLDDNQVWWMLGVETNTWYRYENGGWVVAVPPVLAKARAGEKTFDTAPPLQQDVGDRTIPTSPISDEGFIPRNVPVNDLDYTIPGARAVFMDDPNSQRTVPVTPSNFSEATIASQPVNEATVPTPAVPNQPYNYVASPVQTPQQQPAPAEDAPPSYQDRPASPVVQQVQEQQRRRTLQTAAIFGAIALGVLFLIFAGLVVVGVLYYNSLASPWQDEIAALANYQPQFQTARILAADNSEIAVLTSRSGGARDTIPLSEIAPEMIHAVISTENERFYDDPGWDPIALARAFIQNVSAGEIQSGASTLTQQIARNLILQDTTVSAERKLQELVVAAEIARRYDKNFILELYLNEFFYGNQSYGVEAASQFYFGHSAGDLNLPEAAMLAGLLQAPARYDPVINRQAAIDRMNVVLNLMADVGCIQFQHAPYDQTPFCVTEQDLRSGRVVLDKARVETRSYTPRTFTVRYPHFVNYIQSIVEQNFGTAEMFRRGFTIRTTLDPRLQETAQAALVAQVRALANTGVNTGAIMVTDPRDGAIRAMIGSPDFRDDSIDGQVNNVFTWQQPGSSIKPIVYTAALEGVERNGTHDYYTPATVIWDVPTTFENPSYTPINFDRTFRGPQAVRYALANSLNVPAVKAMAFIGTDRFRETAERRGVRFLPDASFGLPSALGANEVRLYDMVQAYGTLANNGVRVPLFSITSITSADGETIPVPGRTEPTQTIQPQIAYLMQSILSDNNARASAFGLNSGLALDGYPGLVGAKTGTSNDNRDLWTMGFTRNTVVGVWIGRVDNGPTTGSTQTSAVPVWNSVMRTALEGRQPEAFAAPQGIVDYQICDETGTIYQEGASPCTVRTEVFLQSQPPQPATEAFVQTIAIDTWTGMRANEFCTESVITGTFANIDDPSARAWLSTGEGQAWAQRVGIQTPIEPAPENACTANMQKPQIGFSAPSAGQTLSGTVDITGAVIAPNLNRYQLEVASLNNPEQYAVVAGPFNTQVNNGVLAQWNTTGVPNGAYRLRLAAFSNEGGYIYRTLDIGVNNVAPTAQPTTDPGLLLPPTTDPGAATAIPPIDGGAAQSGGSPTIIPLGGLSVIPTPTIDMSG